MTELSPREIIAEIARTAHNAMAAYLSEANEPTPYWGKISDEQRTLQMGWVSALLQDPNSTAASLHAGFVADAKNKGWTRGFVLDQEAKTDPMLRPFAELPQHERCKLAIFATVVHSLYPSHQREMQA